MSKAYIIFFLLLIACAHRISCQSTTQSKKTSLKRMLSQYYVSRENEEAHKDEIGYTKPLLQFGMHCASTGFCYMYCSRTRGFEQKWWYWCWSGFKGILQTCKKDIDCTIPTCAKACNV